MTLESDWSKESYWSERMAPAVDPIVVSVCIGGGGGWGRRSQSLYFVKGVDGTKIVGNGYLQLVVQITSNHLKLPPY